MKRRPFLSSMLLALAILVVVGWSSQPANLTLPDGIPLLPADLDHYLSSAEAREREAYGLVPGTEKRIRWFADSGEKTNLSLVYLHGFSATRQEVAPVTEIVADALGANLFETRLTAHGRERDALRDVRAEDWLWDAAEALAVGGAIGERVIVISTSTGGTLALAMLRHPLMQQVDTLVLMAPNLVLRDSSSEIMTWPGGPLIARLIIGESRSWAPKNELQERYWTTTYPTDSVVEVVRLMQFARESLPAKVDQHILTIASPKDQVVDPVGSREWIAKVEAGRNEHRDFTLSTDPGQHVLAGEILSPASSAPLASIIVDFVTN